MLLELHIENIAVIEKADISFSSGFNVLTGETGAGKSIIIDALQAIMGQRTSRDLVRHGSEKALATGVFQGDRAKNWFDENELDFDDEIILTRRVTKEGKSSCRVSGNPVTATQLKEISGLLLDIHGQNDGRELMNENSHQKYLDSFGNYGETLQDFKEAYKTYKATQKEIKSLDMDKNDKERLEESLKSSIEEIEKAKLVEGEFEEISARRDLMKNGEKLTSALEGAYNLLSGNDTCAINLAEDALYDLERGVRYCADLEGLDKNLKDTIFNLKDIAETVRDFLGELDFSEEEFNRLETRLSKLNKLFRKYSCEESELIEKLETMKDRLNEIEYSDDMLLKLEKRLEKEKKILEEIGEVLTEKRLKSAKILEKRVEDEVKFLSMPSVKFQVEVKAKEKGFDGTGFDDVRFLMSANRGEKPNSISKIASGGELSRIMLAMKNVFSENDGIETMVFDEIDTGVSGIAAQRIGEKLAQLSKNKQVLCVTHLPQIAVMADSHFHIEKHEENGRTYTNVSLLDDEGRIKEIARLHGGDSISDLTLTSAKEQLENANKYKKSI